MTASTAYFDADPARWYSSRAAFERDQAAQTAKDDDRNK
jgi:hypothetical protein